MTCARMRQMTAGTGAIHSYLLYSADAHAHESSWAWPCTDLPAAGFELACMQYLVSSRVGIRRYSEQVGGRAGHFGFHSTQCADVPLSFDDSCTSGGLSDTNHAACAYAVSLLRSSCTPALGALAACDRYLASSPDQAKERFLACALGVINSISDRMETCDRLHDRAAEGPALKDAASMCDQAPHLPVVSPDGFWTLIRGSRRGPDQRKLFNMSVLRPPRHPCLRGPWQACHDATPKCKMDKARGRFAWLLSMSDAFHWELCWL